MTAPHRARAAPAPGVRRVTARDYDHFDLACALCSMDSWSCSKLEIADDRPFPLGKCCSACGEFDVHNVLGGNPVGRGSRPLARRRTLNVLPVPNLA